MKLDRNLTESGRGKYAILKLRNLERFKERDDGGDLAATTNAVPSETVLDVKTFVANMNKMLRNFRRTQLTFVVDRAHQGAPIRYDTPNDGERIELSWLDANRVHQEWPLRLHKVLSEDAAEFVPALVGEFVPKHLPIPPFDVPPEESFEDWWSGAAPPQS